LNTGATNGGSVLKSIIPQFFNGQELTAVWHEFNTQPRWQYRRMSGGQWFWWYMFFLNNEQFVANNEQQWDTVTAPIWRDLYNKVCNYAGSNFIPYRYIINGQTLGQEGHPHSDFARNLDNRTTFLAYLNLEWEESWGGSTIFYNNRVDEYNAEAKRHQELPEPGKLLEYDSRIVHKGTPPLISNVLRVSLSIQGEYV
jgi:hypothetical protein